MSAVPGWRPGILPLRSHKPRRGCGPATPSTSPVGLRDSLWLAAQGWNVTAVDGSDAAIEILNSRASRRGLRIRCFRADLESGGYDIQPAQWDLVVISLSGCFSMPQNM